MTELTKSVRLRAERGSSAASVAPATEIRVRIEPKSGNTFVRTILADCAGHAGQPARRSSQTRKFRSEPRLGGRVRPLHIGSDRPDPVEPRVRGEGSRPLGFWGSSHNKWEAGL